MTLRSHWFLPTGGDRVTTAMLAGTTERLTFLAAHCPEFRSPNLWAGVGLVPGGADLALVGNHAEVANRIEEYHALGIDEFILSGHPHLEEAYWFGEGVLPLLRERGSWSPQATTHRMSVA